MSNELTTQNNGNETKLSLGEIEITAKMMVASEFFKIREGKDSKPLSIAQAGALIMAGQELGIPPFAALTGISIIKGKPALSANIWAGKIKQSGRYDYYIHECSNSRCEIEFFEMGKTRGSVDFTIDDAKKAGLIKEFGGWATYPDAMLFARTITKGARRYCPDLSLGGIYYFDPETGMGELDEGNEPINVTPKQNKSTNIKSQKPAPEAEIEFTLFQVTALVDQRESNNPEIALAAKAELARIFGSLRTPFKKAQFKEFGDAAKRAVEAAKEQPISLDEAVDAVQAGNGESE